MSRCFVAWFSVLASLSTVGVVAAALVAVAVVLIGAVIALVSFRNRRETERRLHELAERLGAPPAIEPGVTGALDRLGEAVDSSALGTAQRYEALLLRTLEAIPQGVVLYAPGGDEVLKNRAATAFLDVRHGGPELDRAVWDVVDRGFGGRQGTKTIEVESQHRQAYLLTGLPLPADDGVDGVGGVAVVIDDISERRRVEALRRDFVANISHELKTPVGAMGLLAETLTAETERSSEGDGAGLDASAAAVVHRLAARLAGEAVRIGHTVDDLLELSQTEVGQTVAAAQVPIVQVLADAADRVRPAAELREVSVKVSCSPAALTVVGDRRQLVTAVANLLDNAVKYSPPGSEVQVMGRVESADALISVKDDGIGIPVAHRDRIFERFYRVDPARSRATGGTGLGLSIVRHVAANHDGDVLVESAEGRGSTFTLRLPIGPPPGGEPTEADAPSARAARR